MKHFTWWLLSGFVFSVGYTHAQSINFNSEYNRLTWPTSVGVSGGLTGDDGQFKRLALFHGHSISLQTGSNEPGFGNTRLYIDTNGKVGIGLTEVIPYAQLHVHGAGGIITTGSGAEFRFRDQSAIRTTETWLDEWVWSAKDNVGRFGKVGLATDIFRFDTYGQVGINLAGTPQARLDVNGDLKANYLSIRPQGGIEGGEISLAGSDADPSWQMDVYNIGTASSPMA